MGGPANGCFCLVDAIIGWNGGRRYASILVGGEVGPTLVGKRGMIIEAKVFLILGLAVVRYCTIGNTLQTNRVFFR